MRETDGQGRDISRLPGKLKDSSFLTGVRDRAMPTSQVVQLQWWLPKSGYFASIMTNPRMERTWGLDGRGAVRLAGGWIWVTGTCYTILFPLQVFREFHNSTFWKRTSSIGLSQ
jgi:hypothetical protein